MSILTNQKLEDILAPIGPFEHHQIVIEFPENLDVKCDKIINELLFGADYFSFGNLFRKEMYNLFKGFDWPLKLFEQVQKRYGQLVRGNSTIPNPLDEKIYSGIFSTNFRWEFVLISGEAVHNAVKYGNKFDNHKKVFIDSYLGDQGIVWTVTDEGDGFDVEKVIRQLKTREKYYQGRGFGFGSFSVGRQFAYNPKGNQWMWQYLFKEGNFKPIAQVKGEK